MSKSPSLLDMLRKRVSQLEVRNQPSSELRPPGGQPPDIHSPGIHPPGVHPPGVHPPEASADYEFDEAMPFRTAKERAVSHWERWYITELVARNGGNLSKAARAARMDRKYLRALVLRYAVR